MLLRKILFTLFFLEINPPDLSFCLLSGLGFVLTPPLGNLLFVLLFPPLVFLVPKDYRFFEKCLLLRISVPVEKDGVCVCVCLIILTHCVKLFHGLPWSPDSQTPNHDDVGNPCLAG